MIRMLIKDSTLVPVATSSLPRPSISALRKSRAALENWFYGHCCRVFSPKELHSQVFADGGSIHSEYSLLFLQKQSVQFFLGGILSSRNDALGYDNSA